ncbi:MAG: lytic transglycosylase domain-containing protein [Acidobacteria bacterium]|nr:lytic transglycosylase domain-containing protein [Acidobacteriota bacterium]
MNQIRRNPDTFKFWRRWIILGVMLSAPALARSQSIHIDINTRQRALAYEPLFITTAQQYNLDPRLLWVIACLESRFRPWAISPKGARGLMQLMPATAARWGVSNPYEPGQAIMGAARYVQYLGRRFDGRVDLTLAAYNAGETAVEAYRAGRVVRVGRKLINPFGLRTSGVPPYRETRTYVSTGIGLLRRLAVNKSATTIAYTTDARIVPTLKSEALTSAPSIRKSISYAADTNFSASSALTAATPRSISYQSR